MPLNYTSSRLASRSRARQEQDRKRLHRDTLRIPIAAHTEPACGVSVIVTV